MNATHNGRTFDAVELQTVIEWNARDGEAIECVAITEQTEYEYYRDVVGGIRVIFTVYGHLAEGGVEALADCETLSDARLIARALAREWGVEVHDYAFQPEDQ